MYRGKELSDGLCDSPAITMAPRHLLCTVCTLGGVDCPLMGTDETLEILDKIKSDPTVTIRLETGVDRIPHYTALGDEDYRAPDPESVLNRKRDLDVLQCLGLTPGAVSRSRHLYTALFEAIETPDGICAYDTPGWEGCSLARSGAYEKVRAQGWKAIVYARTDEEMREYRRRNVEQIETADRLFVRPHHFMCLSCWHAGEDKDTPRNNDTLYEIWQRIRREPDIPVTLVEGCCMACDCCDGFYPQNGRCVHDCGLIRDYKKDLDVFQKLGLMPGATLPGREFLDLLFERVFSTTDICGAGTGVETAREWRVCGGPTGNPGFLKTRETGLVGK